MNHLMKPPVSAVEGSRFSPTTLTSEKIVTKLSALGPAGVLSRRALAVLGLAARRVAGRRRPLAACRPAQMVESKLMTRLRESSLPVSHLQMRGLVSEPLRGLSPLDFQPLPDRSDAR